MLTKPVQRYLHYIHNMQLKQLYNNIYINKPSDTLQLITIFKVSNKIKHFLQLRHCL
jgi:hypothetical protein